MSFRSWLTKKASKTAETVIVQTKESIQKTMETKITDSGNLWFTVGKIGLLGVIFALIMKGNGEQTETPPVHHQPTSIVINNYMNERSDRNDQEHHRYSERNQ